jgi:hypothetical protein
MEKLAIKNSTTKNVMIIKLAIKNVVIEKLTIEKMCEPYRHGHGR